MKKKEKIIYISPGPSTFVQRDISLLRDKYRVVAFLYPWSPKAETPFLFFRQAMDLLWHLPSTKAVLIMFGGYWSLLPSILGKLLKRPVYIILGGTDCVSFPDLNYGSLRKPVLKTCIRWSFQLCKRLIPVDHSLVLSEYSYYEGCIYPKQGFRYFFPRLSTPYTVIYNGFDAGFWKRDPQIVRRRNSFITVGTITNETRYVLKGIDLIYTLAQHLPQSDFIIIGISDSMKNKMLPELPNIEIHPYMSPEEIRKMFSGTEFYVQLSISEGFPNALCEAMLCECIPIGSNVGAIPFIIENSGMIIPKRDVESIRDKLMPFLAMDSDEREALGRSARARIATHFTLLNRERALADLIEGKQDQ